MANLYENLHNSLEDWEADAKAWQTKSEHWQERYKKKADECRQQQEQINQLQQQLAAARDSNSGVSDNLGNDNQKQQPSVKAEGTDRPLSPGGFRAASSYEGTRVPCSCRLNLTQRREWLEADIDNLSGAIALATDKDEQESLRNRYNDKVTLFSEVTTQLASHVCGSSETNYTQESRQALTLPGNNQDEERNLVHLLYTHDRHSQSAQIRNIPDAEVFGQAFVTTLGFNEHTSKRKVWALVSRSPKNSAFTKTGCCLSTRVQKKKTKCVWAGGVEEQDYACDVCTEKGHICACLFQDGDDYVVKWFPLEASKRGDVSYQELAYWRVESG